MHGVGWTEKRHSKEPNFKDTEKNRELLESIQRSRLRMVMVTFMGSCYILDVCAFVL